MSVADTSTQASLLKKLYGSKLETMVYGKSELAKRAKKNTKFGGEDFSFTIRVTPTAGTSPKFEDALASKAASKNVKFTVPRARLFTVLEISEELIAVSKAAGNMGAFDDALKNETAAGLESFSEKFSREIWSEGGGAAGQLHSSTNLASAVLKFRIASDIVGINPGQTFEFSSDAGTTSPGAGLRGAPDRLTVLSVDRDAGEATMSANLNTVAGITVNDYVFLRGSYQQGWAGNRGWVPTSNPSPGVLWCNHDRTTVDILRSSGMRISGGSAQMIETLYDAGAECKMNGVQTKHLFCSPRDLKQLRKEIQSQIQYSGDGKAHVGFVPTLELDSGKVEIISETWIPQGFAWLGDAEDFEIMTAGECPQMLADSNGKMFRTTEGKPNREGRLGAFGNFRNANPGKWVSITW